MIRKHIPTKGSRMLKVPEKETWKTIEDYIRKFDSLNGLKSVEYRFTLTNR